MGAAVGGKLGRDIKTRDPFCKGGDASVGGSILDWVGGRPLYRPVKHCEDISEAADRRQVDVDVRKMAREHVNATGRRSHMSRHLGLLTIQAS